MCAAAWIHLTLPSSTHASRWHVAPHLPCLEDGAAKQAPAQMGLRHTNWPFSRYTIANHFLLQPFPKEVLITAWPHWPPTPNPFKRIAHGKGDCKMRAWPSQRSALFVHVGPASRGKTKGCSLHQSSPGIFAEPPPQFHDKGAGQPYAVGLNWKLLGTSHFYVLKVDDHPNNKHSPGCV